MAKCAICGKPIKEIKVLIHGVIFDMNVCADCLKPYTKPLEPGARPRLGKIVYDKAKFKPKKKR